MARSRQMARSPAGVADHPGALREVDEARNQLAEHPLALHCLEARMQRREPHRNARSGEGAIRRRGLADTVDRKTVGIEIARCIIRGPRGLAEHVEGIALSRHPRLTGARKRLLDRAPHHELLTDDPHRVDHRLADHRLIEATD